jgi:hypothetical protein
MIEKINQDINFEIETPHGEESEKDISAIVKMGDYFLIGSDEGNYLQVLKKQADSQIYKQEDTIVLDPDAQEIDIEGIAKHGSSIYVACSCSLARKSVKADKKTIAENRKRLQTISKKSERLQRCQLFRFSFDSSTGKSSAVDVVSIKNKLTDEESILARFMNIPSKENGVDIEGIAVDDNETLYLGFRGPVLRGNYVPILVTKFNNDPQDYEIRYIQMGGRGVRDLTKVQDGFLIIGGPVGDQESSYNLYFWDGSDTIPGTDQNRPPKMEYLGEIPTENGAKAEGIALIQETPTEYQVIIVYDSLKHGKPGLFRVDK